MPQGEIEKNISLFVKRQFPAIYREDGPELVQLVEDYYKWSETQENQHIYQQRRFFETKDIDTTLESMIIFFKKKFLADLPLKTDIIKFIIKNILDLYRSKGTARGIELFFAIFYQEFDIEIIYPSERMAKISDSDWKQGVYLQMFPNQNKFTSKSGKEYTYFDLLSRNITGAFSGAKASVRSVNFFILNGIKTAVVYLDGIKGTFDKFEDITTKISGEIVSFGKVNGSLSGFIIDTLDKGMTGRTVGEIFDVKQKDGNSGKAIVTAISDETTGRISYDIIDGGYGYTLDNTRLLVSNQSLITNNEDLNYVLGETVEDQGGNEGIVIGQSVSAVGFKMAAGQQFSAGSIISTTRGSNEYVVTVGALGNEVTAKNETSPGDLYPDTGDTDDVIVASLADTSVASVITDLIQPHLGTTLSINDYETVAPFSGTASPVNLTTPLDEAFAIQDLTIGTITGFNNVNPGSEYRNDVFAIAQDSVFKNFERKNQILQFADAGTAGNFSIGDRITGVGTGITGVVKSTNLDAGSITVTPFDYYGFDGEDIRFSASPEPDFEVIAVETDYSNGQALGDNAIINAETEFAIGRVKEVNILSSGFGYVDYSTDPTSFAEGKGELRDANNDIVSTGWIQATQQGVTSGYWSNENSHLSGYRTQPGQSANTTLEYYDAGARIQDSDFYQEYSYQIKSTLPLQEYETLLRENVHLAGSKLFGDFIFKAYVGSNMKPRFLRLFNDQGSGSPFDLADIESLRASVTNYTSDSTYVSADHIPGGSGGLTLSTSSAEDLTITKNWSQGFHDYDVTVEMPTSGSAPYPVAILLHGNGGNGAGTVNQFSTNLPGHILIGVDGFANSWNIANETSKGPDIEMLEELIEMLKIYNNVDEDKIRIVGTSNGGALALRAAVEIGDTAVDTIVCMISQAHNEQYRNGYFYYPSNEEITGGSTPNLGYDYIKNPIPQRRIVLMNGINDNVVPYNGGVALGVEFIKAQDAAYRFAQAQGYTGNQILGGASYGANSLIVDYDNVIFMKDDVGHTVSDDMKNLLNKYLEDDYNITY